MIFGNRKNLGRCFHQYSSATLLPQFQAEVGDCELSKGMVLLHSFNVIRACGEGA
jgi:hypothetical protein